MFENCKNTNSKGNVGLGYCISYLTRLGYIVSLPLNDSQKYDLIFDNGKLNKVQVKSTSQIKNNNCFVKIESCTHNYNTSFNKEDIDYLFVLCENGDSYMIPSEVITSKTSLSLGNKYKKYKL